MSEIESQNITGQTIPVVILAGGRSSRMQAGGLAGDKYLHPIDGKPIIEHLIERLRRQTKHIVLNTNSDQAYLSQFGLPIIADQFIFRSRSGYSGPLAGIFTAMDYAKNHPLVLTAAADTPFIPDNLIEKMLAVHNARQTDVVFAASQHKPHPSFGLWRTHHAERLKHWLQQAHQQNSSLSIRYFAANLQNAIADFPFAQLQNGAYYDPFFNINEPADLIKANNLQKQLKS